MLLLSANYVYLILWDQQAKFDISPLSTISVSYKKKYQINFSRKSNWNKTNIIKKGLGRKLGIGWEQPIYIITQYEYIFFIWVNLTFHFQLWVDCGEKKFLSAIETSIAVTQMTHQILGYVTVTVSLHDDCGILVATTSRSACRRVNVMQYVKPVIIRPARLITFCWGRKSISLT